MGKKSKQGVRDRRAKVEEMRRAQAQAERRKTMMFISIAVVVGLGLIAAAVVPVVVSARSDPANSPTEELGAPMSNARCGPVTSDLAGLTGKQKEQRGWRDHVAQGAQVHYDTVPPSYGPHWAVPLPPGRVFYGPDDNPPVEQLVHNLEHGYLVAWYRPDVVPKQLETLRNLSERVPKERPKFIVAPWDDSFGTFPEGKDIALTVWGHRQLCFKASGEAVKSFSEQFPPSVAPEPTAA